MKLTKQEVIKEAQRVNSLFPKGNILTTNQYRENCTTHLNLQTIRNKLKWCFGDIVSAANLSKNTRGGSRTTNNKRPIKTTRRNCNMRDISHEGKDFWFDAEDDLRSCRSCRNLKNNSESYAGAGLDEFELGLR